MFIFEKKVNLGIEFLRIEYGIEYAVFLNNN